MALIKYPETEWNAFTDIAFCDAFLLENVPSSQRTAYDALTDPDKEIYIKQATTLIRTSITLPDTLEDDLQIATCYLVNYSISLDMTNSDGSSNIKKEVIDKGTIETEYFSQGKESNSFPSIVAQLLSQYGYSSSGTFVFQRA